MVISSLLTSGSIPQLVVTSAYECLTRKALGMDGLEMREEGRGRDGPGRAPWPSTYTALSSPETECRDLGGSAGRDVLELQLCPARLQGQVSVVRAGRRGHHR